jgi:hypothetical protein
MLLLHVKLILSDLIDDAALKLWINLNDETCWALAHIFEHWQMVTKISQYPHLISKTHGFNASDAPPR